LEQKNRTNGRVPFSGYVFLLLAWGLVICVCVQTFIAGLAVFTDPSHWKNHRVFVHIFESLPLLMLIFAFAGKLPGSFRWQSAGLIALIFVQYFTANFPGAGALHPVIALVMFWFSIMVAKNAGRWYSDVKRTAGR
jgi:hypothetical protein